jgi:hypothetical protein
MEKHNPLIHRKPFDQTNFARKQFYRMTFDQKPYDHLIFMNQKSFDQMVFDEFDVQLYDLRQ